MPPVLVIGTVPDAEQRIREAWGESLREHMEVLGLTRKVLRRRLAEEQRIDVSIQTINNWVNGVWAPRASVQIALGSLLKVPVRRLFPLDQGMVA